MSSPLQIGFQDGASFVMKEFHDFHAYAMSFIVFIVILVFYGLGLLSQSAPTHWKFTEKQQVEFWWTASPSIILMSLAAPSMHLLYWMDEGPAQPQITVKTIGHQWYWTYEFWDHQLVQVDSYMVQTPDLNTLGLPRLLEVDNRLVLPFSTEIRVMTHSTDVIHAWCVPALGLKMDAIPGRLNQMFVNIDRPGIFYGQCSEICGANHSFMPIVVESVNLETFNAWCQANLAE